jgi:hypothetical protein
MKFKLLTAIAAAALIPSAVAAADDCCKPGAECCKDGKDCCDEGTRPARHDDAHRA